MHLTGTLLISAILTAMEGQLGGVNADTLALGKPCTAAFHCWRTEPFGFDGVPLALVNGAGGRSKRLEIGGGIVKGTCRCKEGVCQQFQFITNTFYQCDEF